MTRTLDPHPSRSGPRRQRSHLGHRLTDRNPGPLAGRLASGCLRVGALACAARRAAAGARLPEAPATDSGPEAGAFVALLADPEPLSEPLSRPSQASHYGQIRPREPTWNVWVATLRIRYAVPTRYDIGTSNSIRPPALWSYPRSHRRGCAAALDVHHRLILDQAVLDPHLFPSQVPH
jgi:hypothetical protein